jgi:hypothetical protein
MNGRPAATRAAIHIFSQDIFSIVERPNFDPGGGDDHSEQQH